LNKSLRAENCLPLAKKAAYRLTYSISLPELTAATDSACIKAFLSYFIPWRS